MKKELRKKIIAERRAVPAETAERAGREISEKLIAAGVPDVVCSYMAFRGEVDLADLHAYVLSSGRTLLLPYTTEVMTFYRVCSLDQLIVSKMGIAEPDPARCEAWDTERIWAAQPLVATPGVAFTESGFRMGYGGGFYDRFFAARRDRSGELRGTTVGICYRLQIVESLPIEPHDIPVDRICHEEES